jgi:glycosyltransferase involved in cell wall biosynthesis
VSGRLALTGLAPPLRGGIAHYTLHLGAAMGRRAPTRLFAFYRQYPRLLFPASTQIDAAPMGPSVPAVRTLTPLAPWTWEETVRAVLDFAPRWLVHQWWHPWFAPASWTLMRKLRAGGVRLAVLCHNLLPHERVPGSLSMARSALSPAERIVVHGRTDARTARRLWPRAEVRVHPHPPYASLAAGGPSGTAARRALGLDEEGPLVLFFGCVKPYKGLDDLIAALPLVLERQPRARLVVAGEFYVSRAPTERMLDELRLGDRVLLLDRYVPNDQVGTLMGAADVVVLPYRHASGSGVLPMALAAGTPVVATRVGNLEDAVSTPRDGLLVAPRRPRDLARAIVRVIEDPPDRSTIARASAASGWPKLVSTILD